MNSLTQIIRYRRLEQHLKLSELGDASGMSGGIISRFENGITRQTLTTVVKLAYALHIKPAEIATSLGIEYDTTSRPKRGIGEQPLMISDIEAFLEISRTNVAQAKEYLDAAHDEIIHKADLEANELALSDRARKVISSDPIQSKSLPYPPVLNRMYIQYAWANNGVLTLPDLQHFVRKTRKEERISLRGLSAKLNHCGSYNSIARMERGDNDRYTFMDTIAELDQLYRSKGLIFDLFLAAAEFQTGVIRNKARGRTDEPPMEWTKEELATAMTLVVLDRWSAILNIPFLTNLRDLVRGH